MARLNELEIRMLRHLVQAHEMGSMRLEVKTICEQMQIEQLECENALLQLDQIGAVGELVKAESRSGRYIMVVNLSAAATQILRQYEIDLQEHEASSRSSDIVSQITQRCRSHPKLAVFIFAVGVILIGLNLFNQAAEAISRIIKWFSGE